jgi:phosphate transport system substrate-binding protein
MIKNKTLLVFIIFSLLLSCKSKNTTAYTEGELKIYSDTNLIYLLEQFIPVFQNIYPKIRLNFVYKQEKELLEDYFNNITDNIILSRRLLENEISYADQHKNSPSCQYTFAYDAIAVIANKLNSDSVFDISKYKEYSLVFDDKKSGIIETIFHDSIKKINANILSNTNGIISYLQNEHRAIGFVPFNLISNQYDPNTKDMMSKLKVLKVKNGAIAVELNQENVFQDAYPFCREITIISTKSMTSKQKLFSRFLFKERASKLILHSGVIPAKIPQVEINIIDKNFEIE